MPHHSPDTAAPSTPAAASAAFAACQAKVRVSSSASHRATLSRPPPDPHAAPTSLAASRSDGAAAPTPRTATGFIEPCIGGHQGPSTTGPRGSAAEQRGPHEVALDLDRAGPDAQAADVAVGALHRVFAAVAVPAEELDGLVAHALGREVAGDLGHGRLERRRRAVSPGQHEGPLQQEACPFELGGHVGDLPLQSLELRQRAWCPPCGRACRPWRTRARPGRHRRTSPHSRTARG